MIKTYQYIANIILDNIPLDSKYNDVLHFKNENERNTFFSYLSQREPKLINFQRGNGLNATLVANLDNYNFFKNKLLIETPTYDDILNAKYVNIMQFIDKDNETNLFYFIENVDILNNNTARFTLKLDIFTTYPGLLENFTNKVNIVRYHADRFTEDSNLTNQAFNFKAPYLQASEPIQFSKNIVKENINLTYDITNSELEPSITLVNMFAKLKYYYYIILKDKKIYCCVASDNDIVIDLTNQKIIRASALYNYIQSTAEGITLLASYVSNVPFYFFVNGQIATRGSESTGYTYLINNITNYYQEINVDGSTHIGFIQFEVGDEGLTIERKLTMIAYDFTDKLNLPIKTKASSQFSSSLLSFRGSSLEIDLAKYRTQYFHFKHKSCINASSFLDTIYLEKTNLKDADAVSFKYSNIAVSNENSYSIDMARDNFAEWQRANKNWRISFASNLALTSLSSVLSGNVVSGGLGIGKNIFEKAIEIDNIKSTPSSLISQGNNFIFDDLNSDNKPKLLINTISPESENILKDYFKRNGYATNEYKLPVDCLIRKAYNFIQTNLTSHLELPSINLAKIIEEELMNALNRGVRFWEIDNDTINYNFNFDKENYEKRLS